MQVEGRASLKKNRIAGRHKVILMGGKKALMLKFLIRFNEDFLMSNKV